MPRVALRDNTLRFDSGEFSAYKGAGGIPIPDIWTQKANYYDNRYLASGFSTGGKGYIGTGRWGGEETQDCYEYEPVSDVWTPKSDFGGGKRSGAVGFSIGDKGYIGTGLSGISYLTSFYEYDPVSDVWTPKAGFGGAGRYLASGFSIGGKGYIGLGKRTSPSAFVRDFWEYDPVSDVWTQKADFGGVGRCGAVGFSIGDKGYMGLGLIDFSPYTLAPNDLWEYDPVSDVWTQKADFGDGARYIASGFSIGSKGYVGTGVGSVNYKDFWEYDPVSNVWTQKSDFGGGYKNGGVGFSIGDKGYIGLGVTIGYDFWRYG